MGVYNVTTVEKVKTFEGISGTTDDILIGRLIENVTARFESFTDRKLVARSWNYATAASLPNARLNGRDSFEGGKMLSLPQYPINSVSIVRINEMEYAESTGVYKVGWYIHDKNAGLLGLRGLLWLDGFQNIELVYNAGYTAVPEDIDQAAIEQVLMLLKRGKKEHLLGIQSVSHADGSITSLPDDLLPSVINTLIRYKRWTF